MVIHISLNLRKDKIDKKGACPIFVSIRGGGRELYHNTGIKVSPEYWTGDSVRKGWPNYDVLNSHLQLMLKSVEREVLLKQAEGREVTLEDVKILLRPEGQRTSEKGNFHAFYDEYIRYQTGRASPGYLRHLKSGARLLKKYRPRLTFKEITAEFLEGYEMSMKTAAATTKHTKMKRVKEVVDRAVSRGLIEARAVAGYKLPTYRAPDATYLTLADTEKILTALEKGELMFDDKVHKCAAYFLVECYSGIRFSDWTRFSVETMRNVRYLKVRAKKNGEPVYLPLNTFTRLARVIDYIEKNSLKFDIDKRYTNVHLKTMAVHLKLSVVDITTHVGRHTCGTLLAEMGYNTRQIGEVLGISEKTAHTYIKNTRQALANAFERFGGL